MDVSNILPRRTRGSGPFKEQEVLKAHSKMSDAKLNKRHPVEALMSHIPSLDDLSDGHSDGSAEQTDPNVKVPPPAKQAAPEPVKGPSAREISAARAARIRLGYDVADGTTAVEVGKLPTGPEPDATPAPEYVPADQVLPLDDPQGTSKTILTDLETKKWAEACEALTRVRQLTLHHSECIQPMLAELVPRMLKHISSPRSQLTKVAILCFGDVLAAFVDQLLPYIDGAGVTKPSGSIICQLLMKSSSSEKKFVTEAASQVLSFFATTSDPQKVIAIFLPYTKHKNPGARGGASVCLAQAFKRLKEASSPSQALQLASDTLVPGAPNFLNYVVAALTDRSPEARQSSRQCAALLKECVLNGGFEIVHSEVPQTPSTESADDAKAPTAWESFCRTKLNPANAYEILKAVP